MGDQIQFRAGRWAWPVLSRVAGSLRGRTRIRRILRRDFGSLEGNFLYLGSLVRQDGSRSTLAGGEALDQSVTSITLLCKLSTPHRDEAAWREFVDRYGSRIYSWCRARKLPESDAEDVTQEVLLRLARYIQDFEYDPGKSFRGWLRRVTENAIRDYANAGTGADARGGSSVFSVLRNEPDRRQLAASLEAAFDLELLDEAKRRVKARVTATRWQSWEIPTTEAASGKEIAARLGISVGTLYANRNQVQKLIQQEVAILESGLKNES